MNPIRNLVSAALEIALTGFFGSSAHMLLAVGRVFPAAKALAVRIPELWGRAVLRWCHCGVLGYQLEIPPPPPHFEGTTVVICNHPNLADLPALMGVLDTWNLHPALVSKEANLKSLAGIFVGKVLEGTKRGIFINNRERSQARTTIRHMVQQYAWGSILIFPDQHRPTEQALKRDQAQGTRYGIEGLGFPRSGGFRTIVETLTELNVPVRILDVTWVNNEKNLWIRAAHKDRSSVFFERSGALIDPNAFNTRLIGLWKTKSDYCA